VLLAGHTIVLEHQAYEPHVPHRSHEQVTAPLRKGVAGVDLEAGRRNHRIPVVDRLLHALARRGRARDGLAGVLLTVGLHGPAVVLALLDAVQLVPTLGPVLDRPEPALPVEPGGLHVPMPE
jgi:hypothetical protein